MKTRMFGMKSRNRSSNGLGGHGGSANEILSRSGYYQMGGNGRLY